MISVNRQFLEKEGTEEEGKEEEGETVKDVTVEVAIINYQSGYSFPKSAIARSTVNH